MLQRLKVAPWIAELVETGYEFRLIYVWLRNADLAVRRVSARIRAGGHAVPPDTIRRRYRRSIANFWSLYMPLAVTWLVYDNSSGSAVPIARRAREESVPEVLDQDAWAEIQRIATDEAPNEVQDTSPD